MSRTRIVKGNVTEITGGNYKIYTEGDCEYHVGKQMKQVAKQTTYSTPGKAPKKQSPTRVKEIELITPLDDGSANEGNGGTQPGFIFGETYKFKVKSFTNGNPVSNQLIHWMYKYHNLATNKWVEVHSKTKGDKYGLHFNEPEMCGRFIYIRAYIDDEDSEGELKKWHHNKFRWFDRKILEEEIKERTDDKKPWLVNQAGTSLCGMACIFYLFAKEQPKEYKKFAKTLFRTGEATFNKYTVKPSKEILERKINSKKKVENTGGMPLVDYITMAGTRNADNPSYKGGDEEYEAINWPPLMTSLSEDLLGYKDVISHGIYNPVKRGTNYPPKMIFKIVEEINKQLVNGYKIILMIDSDMISEDPDFYIPKKISLNEIRKSAESPFELDYHWVVLDTIIREYPWLTPKGQNEYKLDFKVYSWGGKTIYLKEQISLQHFINNFYGYIKVK